LTRSPCDFNTCPTPDDVCSLREFPRLLRARSRFSSPPRHTMVTLSGLFFVFKEAAPKDPSYSFLPGRTGLVPTSHFPSCCCFSNPRYKCKLALTLFLWVVCAFPCRIRLSGFRGSGLCVLPSDFPTFNRRPRKSSPLLRRFLLLELLHFFPPLILVFRSAREPQNIPAVLSPKRPHRHLYLTVLFPLLFQEDFYPSKNYAA